MKTYDYLIIGNGIAGVTAAETIREHDAGGTIAIISHEPHILYSRVLLPSYLKKRISREKVFLRTFEDFNTRRIDVYLDEITGFVDTARKQIDCASGFSLGYEKLLIASGGRVRGREHNEKKGVYRLQTLEDADAIFHALPRLQKPIVAGASFIGLEFLEILTLNKTPPKILVRDTHFFHRLLDRTGGEMLQENFAARGINVQCGQEIASITRKDRMLHIKTASGENFESDAVFLGIGIERNIEFLAGSGIAVNRGGVETDEYLKTNITDIFAAGDAADYMDVIAKKRHTAGNWTNAFLQGKTAGNNMAGKQEVFKNVSAYSITNFGFQITALGDTDDALETIVQYDAKHNQYARFFIRQDMLAGAALINRFADKRYCARLIESHTLIRGWREKLRDPSFDIQEIPIVE